jgi:HTH-type transcriptional regulator/antitoxin MqsA
MTLQTIQRENFYKSMTAYTDFQFWQDVYHVPSSVGRPYVKFTADAVTEFLLLSFKEKDNGESDLSKKGAPMHRDVRSMTITYKGESLTFDMPGWYCEQSEESIPTGEDMKVSDRMLNRLKARHEGLLDPEEIRRIRKKLRLSQKTAGLVIGGGPRSFQKYESGDLLPRRAISSALMLLDHDPEALKLLKTRQSKSPFLSNDSLPPDGLSIG